MKKMRRMTACMITLILIFSLTGCVGDQPAATDANKAANSVPQATDQSKMNGKPVTPANNDQAKKSTTDNSGLTQTIIVGKTAAITLDENITTGYSWHYVIENPDLVKLDSEKTSDSESSDTNAVPGRVGAGSKHTWNFKGVKPGTTKITFKYYPGWETEKSAVNAVEYTININE